MDGRIKYLTWKHDYEYHSANYLSGLTCVTMAATQALVWAWVSDPDTGSTVFSSVAGGLDDPLNWDGLTPSAHTDASPRVDSIPVLTSTVVPGTELTPSYCKQQPKRCMTLQNQQKAGPWTLEQSADQSGVVLTGANGPIISEVINFDDGTANGIDVITDNNGFAAWPAGATDARIEGPGATWRTPDLKPPTARCHLHDGREPHRKCGDPAPTTTTPDPDQVVELPATGSLTAVHGSQSACSAENSQYYAHRRNREAH